MRMKKVILTKEQAEAIKQIKDIDYAINIHAFNKRPGSPLAELQTSEIARALYIGYEVEPEFKVGDWVYHQSDGIVSQITRVNFNKLVPDAINTDGHKGWISCEDIRHATSEEIKQEKERRFWEKHGREVKEYRKGDLFIHPHDRRVYEIIEIDKNSSWPIRFIDKFGKNDGFGYEAGLRIVCFAEQRLDKEDTQ